ncbi:MAG: trigger factor, partial [Aureliella sp.]
MAATETESEATTAEAPKKPLQIDVKVDVTSTCERHVVVNIPRAEVERYRQEAFNEVSPKAELPGFRAGKAPRKLVESRFKEQVGEQVKSTLVMDSLQQITEGDYFSAISEPDFDYEAVALPAEGDFKYEFKIEVRPDFDTPKWEGLALDRPTCELNDKHVDEHLSRTLKRFMTGEAVDGPIEMGDNVTLSATFTLDGKTVSSFDEEDVAVAKQLKFGDAVVKDFDKLIIGNSEGDEFSTTVTMSEDAAIVDMRGKEVSAKFHII